jgi:hypothetical protein
MCGLALRYVLHQTPEICIAAVDENERALKYVEERFLDDITNGE